MSTYLGTERILIKGGVVLSQDPKVGDLPKGDILIENGLISAIGPDLSVDDARVIDASDCYVLPGFVDTHRHNWQSAVRHVGSDWTLGQYFTGIHFGLSKLFRPEDTYIANLLGRVEALDAGITTMLDWSHNTDTPEHGDAAVAGLLEAGGARSVFAHGGGASMWQVVSAVPHHRDVLRIQKEYFSSSDQLVTLAFAARGPQYATPEANHADFALARELGTRISVHAGDGEWGKRRGLAWMHENGYTGPNVTYVHCNTLADDEYHMLADTGGTASVSADIETQMGHGWPATGKLLDVGVRPSLSIDVCTSNGGDMFHAMKTTISTQRALDNDAPGGGSNADGLRLSCKDVVDFATMQGAIANGLDDKVGSITVGKQADIILVRADSLGMTPHNNPYGALVYSGHAGMVDTVLVAGKVVKENGKLLGVDVNHIKELAQRTTDYLFEMAPTVSSIADARRGGEWLPAATKS
jgi:cytosine/adenosine deaminase-related metal-dependent hydrolase